MPCCSCTTGSPMRTSERSRSIASTLLRRASRLPGRAHDAGVELGLGDQRDVGLGPDETGVQRARDQRGARVAGNESAQSATTAGLNPYSAKYCCMVSRRPRLSAAINTRSRVEVRGASARAAGRRRGGRPGPGGRCVASTGAILAWRRLRRQPARRRRRYRSAGHSARCRRRSVDASSMRANDLSARWNSSSGTNNSFGASSGRARSPRNSR